MGDNVQAEKADGGLPATEDVKTGDPSETGSPKVGRVTLEVFKNDKGATDVRLLELQIPMSDVIIRGVFDKAKEIALMSWMNAVVKEEEKKPKIVNPMKVGLSQPGGLRKKIFGR